MALWMNASQASYTSRSVMRQASRSPVEEIVLERQLPQQLGSFFSEGFAHVRRKVGVKHQEKLVRRAADSGWTTKMIEAL
ncbi:hypothetical protein VQ056_30050 [Paenibacillus sp. JTLBN-2024]